jgi:hypothetical protein
MRGCPLSTGIPRTNLNLTHMVAIFGAFRKVPSVLVADRLQAGPKRHSIESETSGVVRPEKSNLKATYKQDCHSLRSMTAQGHSRRYCHVRCLVRYPQNRTLLRPTEARRLAAFLRPFCKQRAQPPQLLRPGFARTATPCSENRIGLEAQNRRRLASIAYSELARHGRRRWALFVRRGAMMACDTTRDRGHDRDGSARIAMPPRTF